MYFVTSHHCAVLTVVEDIRLEQREQRRMLQQRLSRRPQQELPEEAGEPPADLKLPCTSEEELLSRKLADKRFEKKMVSLYPF